MNTQNLNTIDEALLDNVSGGTFGGCGVSLGGLISAKLNLIAGVVSCGLAVVGSVLSCLAPVKYGKGC
jgi:hypothetical protein